MHALTKNEFESTRELKEDNAFWNIGVPLIVPSLAALPYDMVEKEAISKGKFMLKSSLALAKKQQ